MEGRAGRKDLGLQSRVWADRGRPGYSAVTAERGAERGCWALPGRPKLKRLSIWFELWLTACVLISPCRPRGVGADGAGPAPEWAPALGQDPEPGDGHHGAGPGSTRTGLPLQAWSSCPEPSLQHFLCFDQTQVPLVCASGAMGVSGSPQPPCGGLSCAQCGQTRALWGFRGVPPPGHTCRAVFEVLSRERQPLGPGSLYSAPCTPYHPAHPPHSPSVS